MRSRYLWFLILAVGSIALLSAASVTAGIHPRSEPTPSLGSGVIVDLEAASPIVIPKSPGVPAPRGAPPLIGPAIECFNFDNNPPINGGFLFIPPDPHDAVGPEHVINVGNCYIEWRLKSDPTDLPQFRGSLAGLFAGLPGPPPGPGTTLGTRGFDPKVIYDQYSDRFVVVVLERWDTGSGNPSNESRILVAVSMTPDPNAGWWLHSIASKLVIGGLERWADYPGLGVDDKAVYVTNNMFAFSGGGGGYGGARLWIINKVPTYAGPNNSIAFTVWDPYAAAGIATTSQPAHMYGAPLPVDGAGRPLGTYITSYDFLSDGVNEYVQVVEVSDPLGGVGGPFFAQQFIFVGNIDDNGGPFMPDAPQLGTAVLIATNDYRALNAVWRNDNLYTCAQVVPPAGPDLDQPTAHWWRISTAAPVPGLALADQGNVGSEDLGAGTYTFFPSVMVDCGDNMAIGFAASNPGIFCGAYYASRMATDPPGTVGATCTLQLGLDWYVRTFGGASNRWGDYSGLALCPVDEATFWVYNEYAGPRGTPTGGQDGRWHTKLGRFRLKPPTAVGPSLAAAKLAQNVPNPFNPTTTIRFELPAREHVVLAVYDATGRMVRTLVDEVRSHGPHDALWDGRDDTGKAVGSGVYFYRLRAGKFSESKKMVLLK